MDYLRKTTRWFLFQVMVACVLLGYLPAQAQVAPERKPSKSEQLVAERRKQAQSLLITLASEARSFHDQRLRARALARIADALWEADAEQSRSLFGKSWEAAETSDASAGAQTLGEPPANVRREVLALIAKRDRGLAEGFLEKLRAAEETKSASNSEASLWELPSALQQRLDLAERLLRAGDTRQALEFADPVLGSVTISTLDFLSVLRDKDPVAADTRYTRLLRQTTNAPAADANTVSLLSSYLYTPRMYVVFNREGGADASWRPTQLPPVNVSSQLRLLFFQTASAVLMRPLPPPDQDQTSTGVPGKFMVIRRLLPLFEQHAPEQLTVAMRAQFETLNSLVSQGVREREKEWAERGITPEKTLAEQEHLLLDQIERANTSDARDALYFKLASISLSKDDQNARLYVGKISDTEFRKQAQRWVDWGLALRAIRKKKVDLALDLSRTVELSQVQRAWILTQSATLLAASDPDRSVSVLDQATAETRRIENSEDRPRAHLAIANAWLVVEPARVWEALFEAVKAANSAEEFTGDDGSLALSINSRQALIKKLDYLPEFEIRGIFTEIAGRDFDRAVQLAHGFRGEAARTNATIAICGAILKQNTTVLRSSSAASSKN